MGIEPTSTGLQSAYRPIEQKHTYNRLKGRTRLVALASSTSSAPVLVGAGSRVVFKRTPLPSVAIHIGTDFYALYLYLTLIYYVNLLVVPPARVELASQDS